MNAANIAQHKIFRGKSSFVDKKMAEKSRFGELSTEEIQEIVDNAVSVTTTKTTKFGMRLLNGTYQLSFLKSCKISNTTVAILRIRGHYVTTRTFTSMLQNG